MTTATLPPTVLARLHHDVVRLSEENARLTARFLDEERRASDLMKLLLAVRQLHEARDRAALLAALEDVVINVLGSEMLALYVLNDAGDALVAERTVGIDVGGLDVVRLAGGTTERIAALDTALARAGYGTPLVTAPLAHDDVMVGAIVIFGLLEHKPELDTLDHELLELLSVHAGIALAATARGTHRTRA